MLIHHARSLLFLPASNERAIAKARDLPCDMVLLDLEDAVADDRKGDALANAVAALKQGFGKRLTAVRINSAGTSWRGPEMVAMKAADVDYIILPKVEDARQVKDVFSVTQKPVIAMIESAKGVIAASVIAAAEGTAALFMGTNDLRQDLRILQPLGGRALAMPCNTPCWRPGPQVSRSSTEYIIAWMMSQDWRPNVEGHALGFDGKTLIHPSQIAVANRLFAPDRQTIANARRLIEAATGGAERFEGRMIEAMHVREARALIARAEAVGQ